MTTISRPAIVGTMAALVLGGLGACSSTDEQVSDEIAKQAQTQLELETEPKTECPDDAEAGEGESFECTITIEGTDLPVQVDFSDDTNFTFEPQGYVSDLDDAEASLAGDIGEQVGAEVTVDCGDGDLLVIALDGGATCTATDGETTVDVELTLDADGAVQFEIVG